MNDDMADDSIVHLCSETINIILGIIMKEHWNRNIGKKCVFWNFHAWDKKVKTRILPYSYFNHGRDVKFLMLTWSVRNYGVTVYTRKSSINSNGKKGSHRKLTDSRRNPCPATSYRLKPILVWYNHTKDKNKSRFREQWTLNFDK